MNEAARTELAAYIKQLVLEELAGHGLAPCREPLVMVPVGVSARHMHVTKEHMAVLFGPGSELTVHRPISQPGQFAANEQVTLVGPKGTIERVRILGPYRKKTQIELAPSDARRLGLEPPVRRSGDIAGTPGITVIGPYGKLELDEGCIIAERHIHMTPADAEAYGVRNGQKVKVRVDGVKGGIMDHVMIRVRDDFKLELHIDTDDANGFGIKNGSMLAIIREEEGQNRW
jgi:putative phosphotransacetylase